MNPPYRARRLVDSAALQHFLWNDSKKAGRADPRPLLKWFGICLSVAALALQAGVRMQHTTFDAAGIHWRDWPWESERFEPWTAVSGIRLVTKPPTTNRSDRAREYLDVEYADGTTIHIGPSQDQPPGTLGKAARLAGELAEVPVVRIASED